MTSGRWKAWARSRTAPGSIWARTDVGIVRYRRMLRAAIDSLAGNAETALPMRGGADLSGIVGPLSNDAIADTADWEAASRRADRERRAACPWDASV